VYMLYKCLVSANVLVVLLLVGRFMYFVYPGHYVYNHTTPNSTLVRTDRFTGTTEVFSTVHGWRQVP
jgi:hypothetical protein